MIALFWTRVGLSKVLLYAAEGLEWCAGQLDNLRLRHVDP